MADTRPDVSIPMNTWKDIYAVTGIAVGTAVQIYNKGSSPCLLVIKATQPTINTMGVPLGWSDAGNNRYISAGESGLWVYSAGNSTYLCVQEA